MSDGKVVYLDLVTTLPVPYDRVLTAAIDNLEPDSPMLVLGYEPDGGFYMASSQPDLGHLLILLERAKAQVTRVLEEEDDD